MDLRIINGVVPVTKESFKAVMADPAQLFDMMELDFRQIAQTTLNAMLRQELTAFLGREIYSRSADDMNHRNGFCGPALIAIGSVLMIAKNNLPVTWRRHVSSDGLASAEFPAVVEAKELSDKADEVTVRRTSFNYNVPGKDMSLFFSFSPVPGESRGVPDEQYIDQTIAVLATQGSTLVGREQAQGSPIHRLTFRNDAHKANIVIAVAYRNGNAYRTAASWTDGSEDEELVRRFTGSFRVEAAGKNP